MATLGCGIRGIMNSLRPIRLAESELLIAMSECIIHLEALKTQYFNIQLFFSQWSNATIQGVVDFSKCFWASARHYAHLQRLLLLPQLKGRCCCLGATMFASLTVSIAGLRIRLIMCHEFLYLLGRIKRPEVLKILAYTIVWNMSTYGKSDHVERCFWLPSVAWICEAN